MAYRRGQRSEGDEDRGERQRPVESFRYPTGSGSNVEVAVWARENDGRTSYSVTLARNYRVDKEWKQSKSLFPSDLAAAALALEDALRFIVDQGK